MMVRYTEEVHCTAAPGPKATRALSPPSPSPSPCPCPLLLPSPPAPSPALPRPSCPCPWRPSASCALVHTNNAADDGHDGHARLKALVAPVQPAEQLLHKVLGVVQQVDGGKALAVAGRTLARLLAHGVEHTLDLGHLLLLAAASTLRAARECTHGNMAW